MDGQIVILNGPPRAGKSSIATVIQNTFDGVWMNLGVDHFQAMTPPFYRPGIGLRPGGERPDLEPLFVGVHCPVDVVLERRRATWGGVGYNQGGTVTDPVGLWHEAVHTPGLYDVEVDTSVLSADECAEIIRQHLAGS